MVEKKPTFVFKCKPAFKSNPKPPLPIDNIPFGSYPVGITVVIPVIIFKSPLLNWNLCALNFKAIEMSWTSEIEVNPFTGSGWLLVFVASIKGMLTIAESRSVIPYFA